MDKTAAVVVLYNPEKDVFERNIPSYHKFVDLLIVVDNSKTEVAAHNESLVTGDNVKYIGNNDNLGIAKALNTGAQYAVENGCKWLLTMDQDSYFDESDIKNLLGSPARYDGVSAGIFSPVHVVLESPAMNDTGFTEKSSVMTSGNLLNLEAYKNTGPFLDNYFIDYVDHEYCFRLRKEGYKILQVNNSFLHHKLGDTVRKNLLKSSITLSNHSALRKYYLVRNMLYFNEEYKDIFREDVNLLMRNEIKTIIKMLVFEPERLKKLKMVLKGISHYKKGIKGRYEN